MKRLHILTIIIIAIVFSNSLFADWQTDLDSLIRSDDSNAQKRLLKKVVKANPDFVKISAFIENISFPECPTGVFLTDSIKCIDGRKRPYVLYIPPAYDPTLPTPLFVVLHDRVSDRELIENPEQYAREHDFQKYIIEKKGWIGLYPFGQNGAAWWEEVGMTTVKSLVREVKRDYNVDDDRVYLGGADEGASGAFGFAMLDPTDFAAVVGIRGDLTFSNRTGDLPTYPVNLTNTFMYMGLEEQSNFSPSSRMFPIIQLLKRIEAKTKIEAPLSPDDSPVYSEADYENVLKFLHVSIRPRAFSFFTWETSDPAFGKFQWFSIDKINRYKPAPWHRHYNPEVFDSSILLGFNCDRKYDGSGVCIEQISEEENLAKSCDLRPGDIILKGNDIQIDTSRDFERFKRQLRPGGPAILMIERNGQRFVVYGTIPAPKKIKLFDYEKLSCQVQITRTGNVINIDASRLAQFTFLVLPELYELDKNLQIIAEGKIIFNDKIEPDLEFMLQNFLDNRDRRFIYIAGLSLKL